MDKATLCEFIYARPRTMHSLLKRFGYDVIKTQYLTELFNECKIAVTERYDKGFHIFYTKSGYIFKEKPKVKGAEILTKRMANLLEKRKQMKKLSESGS